MELVVLLSVFAITHTHVVARPADTEDNNNETKDTFKNKFKDNSDIMFRLPTSLRHGYTVTINGTINSAHKTFTAILPALSGLDHEHCRFVYDFGTEIIDVSPFPDVQNEYYNLYQQDGEPMRFSLNIKANRNDENHMFKLTFEANDAGESPMMYCKINSFDDFDYIVIKEGVHNISSLLFEFL